MTQRAVLRHSWVVAVVTCVIPAAALHVQGQFVGPSTSSRQAEDRRVDESSRQTQPARQTEALKPADSQKPSEAQSKSQSRADNQRQPEPQRQHEPARQREPQRQAEPSRRNDSDHWKDPGPAWRSLGPAWRDLNERRSVDRPGEDVFRSNPNTDVPRNRNGRRDRDARRNGNRNRNVYVAVPYPVPYDLVPYYPSQLAPEPAPEPAAAADEQPLGFLTLRVQPRTAEVFVDGAFTGIVDDFGGRGARQLPAGTHRVEIVATGFETLTFDVRVPEHDTVTFTRELTPAVERPAQEPVVIPHKALYIVPRCYIGDRPPQTSDMPAGCSVADLRVIP